MNEFQLSELSENIDISNQEGNVEEKLQKMDEESVKPNFQISFFTIDCSLRVSTAQDSISSKLESVSHNFVITTKVMKYHMLVVSLSVATRFGYLDHHVFFIIVFDLDSVLTFLTNKYVRFFNHPIVLVHNFRSLQSFDNRR